jgi:hypothetical protein
MDALQRRDLINYAFVSQGIFGASDLLAAMLPLLQPIVHENCGKIFDPQEFARLVNDKFPWNMNSDAAEEIVPRMEKAGWLKLVVNDPSSRAYVYTDIESVSFDSTTEKGISERLQNLGVEFRSFLDGISPLEARAFEADELEELLLKWLINSGGFDTASIQSAIEESLTDFDEAKIREMPVEEIRGKRKRFRQQEDYICARFIQHLNKSNQNTFDTVVELSALALVAEVILTYSAPRQAKIDTQVEFYYDGPFAMDLLGLTGFDRKRNAEYIHSHLSDLGIGVRIFDHSCDEIVDNLTAMLSRPKVGRHGPTWDAIRKAEILESFAVEVRDSVETFINNINIPIVHVKSALVPNEEKYFTDSLKSEFADRLSWENRRAAQRDAQSIAFVMRRRRDRRHTNVFRSNITLITRNEVLAGFARRFCLDYNQIGRSHVPPILHQRRIAALLFLTFGNDEKREVTRRELMATCSDIVRCRPDVVDGMMSRLKMLDATKAEEFGALIQRPRCTQLLMDLTLGANDLIYDRADEVFDRIRVSAAEDVEKRKNQEIERIKESSQRTRNRLQERIKSERAKREEVDGRVAELLETETKAVAGWLRAAKRRWRQEYMLMRGAFVMLIIVSVVGTAWASSGALSLSATVALTLLAGLLSGTCLVLQVYNHFPKILEVWLEQRRDRFFRERAAEAGMADIQERFEIDWEAEKVQRLKNNERTFL